MSKSKKPVKINIKEKNVRNCDFSSLAWKLRDQIINRAVALCKKSDGAIKRIFISECKHLIIKYPDSDFHKKIWEKCLKQCKAEMIRDILEAEFWQ